MSVEKINIIVVDDEEQIRNIFARALDQDKYRVVTAGDCESARREFSQRQFHVAMVDLVLPDATGLDLLQHIRSIQPNCRCIIMTGFGTTKSSVKAIQLGAYDYIEKPFGPLAGLLELIERAAGTGLGGGEGSEWADISRHARGVGLAVGESIEMKQLLETACKIAGKKVSVLITGETGTGKELMAKFIHAASNRSGTIFIPVNCGALHENILESELFGHEKGAFTGASSSRKGIFELAHKGTLFLDEIAEASQAIQVKLLRVLETGEFLRVGGEKTIKTDVRVIAATNAPLETLVRQKLFREDLFFRLDVVRLEMIPLRRRIEDIPILARTMIERSFRQVGLKKCPVITDEAINYLARYAWPGNIRELHNILQQIMIKHNVEFIEPKHLPPKILIHEERRTPFAHTLVCQGSMDFVPRTMREVEREHINRTLEFYKGHVSQAARALGLSRATIYRKIKH